MTKTKTKVGKKYGGVLVLRPIYLGPKTRHVYIRGQQWKSRPSRHNIWGTWRWEHPVTRELSEYYAVKAECLAAAQTCLAVEAGMWPCPDTGKYALPPDTAITRNTISTLIATRGKVWTC